MSDQKLVEEICPTTTQQWVKNGALLIDVREADEVLALSFDVPNIINIPLSQFENYYTDIPTDQNLVIVCKDGTRSLRAAGFLVNHGYDKVVNMQHGMIRWLQKGFPVKGDSSAVAGNDSGCCSSSSCC